MPISWRDRQKTFFVDDNIEFEQDQRIIDWVDITKKTYVSGETYFNDKLQLTHNTNNAEQAIVIFKQSISIKAVENLCKQLVNIPRVCIAINKFLVYTNTFNDVNEDYDIALLELIQSIFTNRKIDYYYIPNDDGTYFNFASPATQFFIT